MLLGFPVIPAPARDSVSASRGWGKYRGGGTRAGYQATQIRCQSLWFVAVSWGGSWRAWGTGGLGKVEGRVLDSRDSQALGGRRGGSELALKWIRRVSGGRGGPCSLHLPGLLTLLPE